MQLLPSTCLPMPFPTQRTLVLPCRLSALFTGGVAHASSAHWPAVAPVAFEVCSNQHRSCRERPGWGLVLLVVLVVGGGLVVWMQMWPKWKWIIISYRKQHSGYMHRSKNSSGLRVAHLNCQAVVSLLTYYLCRIFIYSCDSGRLKISHWLPIDLQQFVNQTFCQSMGDTCHWLMNPSNFLFYYGSFLRNMLLY